MCALGRSLDQIAQVECMGLMEKLQRSAPASYQMIVLFDVIEHLTKREILDVFELVTSRLSPGGRVIVHCPNGDSPFVSTVRYGDFTHETVLTPSSARNLCNLFGLKDFDAKEHLAASKSFRGFCRRLGWSVVRQLIRAVSAIETGSAGSGVFTRNFAFKAQKDRG